MDVLGDVDGQEVGAITLAVCGVREDQLDCGGTCFLLNSGMAITAKHVIESIDEHFSHTAALPGPNVRDYAIHLSAQAQFKNVTFAVEGVYPCQKSDLAVLHLRPLTIEASRHEVKTPSLNFAPPQVGDGVFTFGFAKQTIVREGSQLRWTGHPRASEGVVRQFWAEGRDSLLMPFPSFETSAVFQGHMSGSPVANLAGEIIGVVSRSWDFGNDLGEPVSYAAALWPLLATGLRIPRDRHPDEPYYFFDLLRDHYLPGINWDHPNLDPRNEGSR